ncbi:MAG: FtsX-like permease family protein, partial [Actinomycetia bacterium]|nr:FtsX-like permease family protein [Actinomycetes bacterium]
MKKLLHLAQANIRGHKSSTLSLFIIIVIVSTLMTVGLSILFGINQDFASIVDRSNSLHSAFVMTKDTYSETFEEVIRDDPRVSQYEIVEVLSPESITLDYGGQTDVRAILFDLDTTYEISPPVITASDSSIPPQRAIYLPEYATGLGYRIGDELTLTYKNKPIALTVAGFFATNEFSTVNMASALKFLVPHESYELLAEQFNRSVWIAIRMNDMDDSPQFNQDFASQIDVDLSSIGLVFDSDMYASVTSLVSLLAVIIVVFSLLIVLISILVIRFRIMSSIEDALHEIGVLKSAGYKNAQIVGSYVMEYFIVSLPAALLGVLFALPLFPLVRDAMSSMSGFSWTIGIHPMASMAAVILLVALILMMVLLTCRTIMKLLPVDALRGGASAQKSYRHLFPLGRGAGGLQTKLGLKSIAVFLKTYVMTGLVIAMMTISIIIVF